MPSKANGEIDLSFEITIQKLGLFNSVFIFLPLKYIIGDMKNLEEVNRRWKPNW
jgi:hypothetical protein